MDHGDVLKEFLRAGDKIRLRIAFDEETQRALLGPEPPPVCLRYQSPMVLLGDLAPGELPDGLELWDPRTLWIGLAFELDVPGALDEEMPGSPRQPFLAAIAEDAQFGPVARDCYVGGYHVYEQPTGGRQLASYPFRYPGLSVGPTQLGGVPVGW